jgi:hypothetical protein
MTDMLNEAVLTVRAGDLQRVLDAVVPTSQVRKGLKVPITLAFLQVEGMGELEVSDAVHGARSDRLAARGEWRESCQMVGADFRTLLDTYPPEAELDLIQTEANLIIRRGRSRLTIQRLDGAGKRKIHQRKQRPDPRHKGPVVIPPNPVQKRVARNDTWAFSARVPMEEHKKPRKI